MTRSNRGVHNHCLIIRVKRIYRNTNTSGVTVFAEMYAKSESDDRTFGARASESKYLKAFSFIYFDSEDSVNFFLYRLTLEN